MATTRKPGRPRKDEKGPSARERILDAARDGFYARGIDATSIDDVAARADVSKMTVYQHFATKQALAVAYLHRFEEAWDAWVAHGAPRRTRDARAQILRIFDRVGAFIHREGYCGCAFINAALEDRHASGPIAAAALDQRQRTMASLVALARESSAKNPAQVADQLMLLIDGALVGSAMGRPGNHAAAAKRAAATILDGACATSPRTSSRRSPSPP